MREANAVTLDRAVQMVFELRTGTGTTPLQTVTINCSAAWHAMKPV